MQSSFLHPKRKEKNQPTQRAATAQRTATTHLSLPPGGDRLRRTISEHSSPSVHGSTGSAAEALDEVLHEVLQARCQSLADVRSRISDLAELQRRETDAFVKSMRSVLERSDAVTRVQQESEAEWELSLQAERVERQKAFDILAKFRAEGTAVMSDLKEALREVQKKYKAEVERSNALAAELHRANRGSDNAEAVSENRRLKDKVSQLAELLEEQDQIVVTLQKRCATLEQGAGRLDAAEFSAEAENLVLKFRDCENRSVQLGILSAFSGANGMSQGQLVQLVQLLLKRLSSEQRQRLRVEEQAGKMASAQDQLLRKMESRVKELEKQARKTRTGSPTSLRPSQSAEGPRLPLLTAAAETSLIPAETKVSSPANQLREPRKQAIIGLEEAENMLSPLPKAPERQRMDLPAASRSLGDLEVPSLDAQLEAVTADFHQSLKQWQDALECDDRTPAKGAQ